MKLYHGSTENGITELSPVSKDKDGHSVLYLTDNFAYSLFYLRDRKTDFVTCGVAADGKVHYYEWFPNQIKTLYNNRSGWIYEVDTNAEPYRIRGIHVCREAVAVTQRHYIEDAYSAILNEIKKGTVIVRSFDEVTKEQLQQYREDMVKWLRTEKNMSAEKKNFYRTYFPECWESAYECR